MVRPVHALRRLVEFEASVACHLAHAVQQGALLRFGHRRVGARRGHVLPQLLHRGEAHHQRRDRLAERVADARRRGDSRAGGNHAAAQALHADDASAPLDADGNDLLAEAAELRVHHVDGHLHRFPIERFVQHSLVDARVAMPGEADVPNLARFLGFHCRPYATVLEDPVRVVLVDDLVELPEIQIVRPQPLEAFVDAAHGARVVAFAPLGHQEDLVPPATARQRLAHHLLAAAVVVVPGVVEEGDAFVDGRMHHLDRRGFVLGRREADVPTAEAKHGDVRARAPQRTNRQPDPAAFPGRRKRPADRQHRRPFGGIADELAPRQLALRRGPTRIGLLALHHSIPFGTIDRSVGPCTLHVEAEPRTPQSSRRHTPDVNGPMAVGPLRP